MAGSRAKAEARVGIAAALAGAGHGRHRAAIERAASATANEPLRISLEQAAGGDLNHAAIAAAARLDLKYR